MIHKLGSMLTVQRECSVSVSPLVLHYMHLLHYTFSLDPYLIFKMLDLCKKLFHSTCGMLKFCFHVLHLTKDFITVHINTHQGANKLTVLQDTKTERGL
jgi:hypothetical protein